MPKNFVYLFTIKCMKSFKYSTLIKFNYFFQHFNIKTLEFSKLIKFYKMKYSIHIPTKGYFQSIRQFYLHSDKPLGVGSFGTVKLATHVRTNKNYAIKIVDIGQDMSETELKIL